MKHFESLLASVMMFVGVLFAGNVSAQTEPEWEGAAVAANLTNDGAVYLYNVGAKAFFVNGGDWGTHAALNINYGLPFINIDAGTGSSWRFETDLKTTQGTFLCLITENNANEYFCDRTSRTSDGGNINLKFEPVSGTTNNEYYIYVNNGGNKYMSAEPIVGISKKGTVHTTDAPDGDYSKWIIITSATIKRHLEKKPSDLENPTNVTYLINDPNLDRGNIKQDSWKLVNWNIVQSDGTEWVHTRVNSMSSNRDYRIGYELHDEIFFMTLAEDGTLGVTTDPDEAAVWHTSPNDHYLLCNGWYLGHINDVLTTTKNRTSANAYWSSSSSNGIYYSGRRINYVDGEWTYIDSRNNLARPYLSSKDARKGDGLKLGVQGYYKTAPDNQGESSVRGDNSNAYRTEWGKYFGAEARGVAGKFQQQIKVYHTGWYSVSCEGFYWNDLREGNDVVTLFATANGQTAKQYLALGNNEGAVPANWGEAAKELFPATRYTNAVMFFVEVPNANPITGYNANGVTITIGLDWDASKADADDWTVFDDFQLEFMGYNKNLILEENTLDYDYLLTTKEEYKNETLLLNRMFTEKAWNTLVLPVDLTKKQFLTAFGANARIANLIEVKDGVLRFETIKKSDKSDDFVLLEAGKPYIVYIENNPRETKVYEASLTPIEGTSYVMKSIGGADQPYYIVPRVTLDKDNLAGVNAYSYGDGDASVVFNGTLVKTYEGTTIRPGFDNMKGNIIFKDGSLWWLTKEYGMKAFRGWLEPNGYNSEADGESKIIFEIDGLEDNATTIRNIFNGSESVNEKYVNGIYSINGVNMGTTSLDNLPKGIYIVNGKKYIVK